MKKILTIFLFIVGFNVFAANQDCTSLRKCVEYVANLTNTDYIIDGELKGSVAYTKNFKVEKENAELLLSEILNSNGYTRVEVTSGVYKIISSRDIRYTPVKEFTADKKTAPQIPNLKYYYMLKYTGVHPEIAKQITRSLRPFMSRYGRIINMEYTGTILVQDTGVNLQRLYKIISENDIKPNFKILKEIRDKKKIQAKLDLIKAQSCEKK